MSNIKSIKAKLAALLARARDAGSSDAEIAACMTRADKIMEEYNLSESDLDNVTSASFRTYAFTTPERQTRLCPVVRHCAANAARYTATQVWLSGTNEHGHAATLQVFGLEADVEFCSWLLKSWRDFMDDQWIAYKDHMPATDRRTMTSERVGFVQGFTGTINKRLSDHIRDAKLQRDGGVKTGFALVVKKNDLIAREMSDRGINLGKETRGVNGNGRGTASGANAGAQAGARANVGRGVGKAHIAIGN